MPVSKRKKTVNVADIESVVARIARILRRASPAAIAIR
jgi:hypothetical protein